MHTVSDSSKPGPRQAIGQRLVAQTFLTALLLSTLGPFLISTLAFLTLALLLHVVAVSHRVVRRLSSLDVLLGLFVFALIAGEMVINANVNSALELMRWIAILLIARNLVALFGPRTLLTSFAILSAGLSFALVLSSVMGLEFAVFDEFRIVPEFMHKNDIATLVGLGTVALFSITVEPRRSGAGLQKIVGWVGVLFLLMTLLLLNSLAALGGTGLALGGLLLFHLARHTSPFQRRLAILSYLASPFLAVAIAQVSGLFALLGRRSDFHGRLEIWAFTVSDWGSLWVFGSPGTYWTAERARAFDESTPLVGPVMVSDNSFLDIFLDHGILPLVIFVAIIVFWLVRLFRLAANGGFANAFAFPAILYYLLIVSFFSSTLLSPYIFLPFGIALFASASTKASKHTAPPLGHESANNDVTHPLHPRRVELG